MPNVKAGGWTFNYLDQGSGPVVLLLHGLAGDHTAWTPQLAALTGKYRVIAPDNPGSGGTSLVPSPVTLVEVAEAYIALLEELEVESAHVVGRSMGGGIAQEMALMAPDRVASLTLAGSFAKLDPLGVRLIENMRDLIQRDPDWARWTRLFSHLFVSPGFFMGDSERLRRLESIIADERRDAASYVNLANACLQASTVGRLAAIACPTMVMASSIDPICSPTATQWVSAELPDAPVVMFDEGSHFFLMEEAAKANAALLDWLGRNASRSASSAE